MVDTPASKAGARLGVRVRVSRLVLGEAKRFNTSARVRVLWPTLGRVALWLVPPVGRLVSYVWRMVRGFLLRAARARWLFCFPSLDSNPARCRVRLLIGSLTLRGWGSSPLLSAEAHARVGRFVRFRLCPSFCRSKNAREDSYLFLVSAMPGRLSASSGWAHSLVGVCSGGSLSPVAGP